MAECVILSQETLDFITKIKEEDCTIVEPFENSPFDPINEATINTLDRWFASKPQENKRTAFTIEQLNAALLQDLYDHIAANEPIKAATKPKPSWKAKLTFGLLVIAGTIYFACEGFDGVSALMGVFAVPPLPVFLVGVAFSALSILIFYGLELFSISNSLGIQFKSAPKIIDLYLRELRLMKGIRKKLAETFFSHDRKRLEEDLLIINLLRQRLNGLHDAKEELGKTSRHWLLRAAKMLTATLPGLIFFSAGFFAGQTVAIAIASLFMTGVVPTFWPIIIVSALVGLASLTIYWIIQRPGIANIVSTAAGLDQEKLDELSSHKRGEQELNELNKLARNINELKEKAPYFLEDNESEEEGLLDLSCSQQPKASTLLLEISDLNCQDGFDKGYGNFALSS